MGFFKDNWRRIQQEAEKARGEPMKELKLEDLPNVGPMVTSKLRMIGIATPPDLAGRDPFQMFEELSERTASGHDPCLLDVLIAVTRYASGEPAQPWWSYTAERKAKLSRTPDAW